MPWNTIPGRSAYRWIYDEWVGGSPKKDAVVVEVGVGLGKSLAYLCEVLDAAGRSDVIVLAVDPWSGTSQCGEQQSMGQQAGGDFSLYAKTMLEHAPRAFERVRVLRCESLQAAEALDYLMISPSLVIIDADHGYESARADISAWNGILDNEQGWIGGDDYVDEYPGVIRAVRETFGDAVEVRHQDGWGTWLHRPKGAT